MRYYVSWKTTVITGKTTWNWRRAVLSADAGLLVGIHAIMLVLVLVIVTKVSLTAGYHQPLLKFKCPNSVCLWSVLYVYWTATYQYKFISCSEFFRNFSRGMAPPWRHCSWCTQDESDVISSYHIHASCFPAMMWGRLWEWEICLLLWRHFLCKIVTTRTLNIK